MATATAPTDGERNRDRRPCGGWPKAEPELAARLILQSLPAAAATLPAGLSYRLELEDLGAWRVSAPATAPRSPRPSPAGS